MTGRKGRVLGVLAGIPSWMAQNTRRRLIELRHGELGGGPTRSRNLRRSVYHQRVNLLRQRRQALACRHHEPRLLDESRPEIPAIAICRANRE
jgi:hypothetical protein